MSPELEPETTSSVGCMLMLLLGTIAGAAAIVAWAIGHGAQLW